MFWNILVLLRIIWHLETPMCMLNYYLLKKIYLYSKGTTYSLEANVPASTWNAIQQLTKKTESPEIIALLHGVYNLNRGLIMML